VRAGDDVLIETLKEVSELMVYGDKHSDRFFEYVAVTTWLATGRALCDAVYWRHRALSLVTLLVPQILLREEHDGVARVHPATHAHNSCEGADHPERFYPHAEHQHGTVAVYVALQWSR
jgi:hypothetical protein